MGSFWFLKLALGCVHLLSWPLLALVYPLCASIQAIETDSHSDIRNLISYWILLSLIYLFEYAFLKLLEWFQYWSYIKLMIIIWLVIPDFGRASYVYNHLIRSCLSMNPQAVISWLSNEKKLLVKKESFLVQAEKYVKENGTEALEKLIAGENTMQNLDAEAMKAGPATEKNEMQQTNGIRIHMEQQEIKDLEMIEKEVPQGKQGNTAAQILELNEKRSPAKVETGGKDTAGGESSQSCASKKVQNEWTCAICLVTTTSEKTLNIHLHGKKHHAKCEALKAKNQSVPAKSVPPASAMKKNGKSNEESVKTASASALKQKNVQTSNVQEHAQPNGKPEKSKLSEALKQPVKDLGNKSKGAHAPANETDKLSGNAKGTSVGMNHSRLRCEICNVHCTSNSDMASHLNGRKHLAQIQFLMGQDIKQ